jgi:hypothetical protein
MVMLQGIIRKEGPDLYKRALQKATRRDTIQLRRNIDGPLRYANAAFWRRKDGRQTTRGKDAKDTPRIF